MARLGMLTSFGRRIGRWVRGLLRFGWWFVVQQAVTIVWMTVLSVGFWMAWPPLGVIVCAVCLWMLEMKVERDLSDLR